MERYTVPKDILCHYSSFFDRCFNGGFREAREGKLIMREESIEHFELLLEYVLSGKTPTGFKASKHDAMSLDRCIRYIEFCERYDVSEAGLAVYDTLVKVLKNSGSTLLNLGHVETIFRVYPEYHRFRALIAKAVINGTFNGNSALADQAGIVMGFREEMQKQSRLYPRWR